MPDQHCQNKYLECLALALRWEQHFGGENDLVMSFRCYAHGWLRLWGKTL
jgi:hypothetical protein